MVSEIFEPFTSVVFSVRKSDTSSRRKKSRRVALLRPLVDGWSGQPQSSVLSCGHNEELIRDMRS
jgi:hypothetical protein